MSRPIEPGQEFVAAAPDPSGPVSIRISDYEPGSVVARFIAGDTGASGIVWIEDLHDSPTTRDGQPRRTGYVLDTSKEQQ